MERYGTGSHRGDGEPWLRFLTLAVLVLVGAWSASSGAVAALGLDTGHHGPTPAGDDGTTKIQPGAAIITPHTTCTAGFVHSGPDGTRYLSTAGHCFGDQVECRYDAARVRIDGVGVFGSKAFCVRDGLGSDLALIRIDADKHHLVDPAMKTWGGPSAADGPIQGLARHYGHGIVYDSHEVTRARSGHTFERDDATFRMTGLVTNGDSGSPVRSDDGHAIGIITHANGNLEVVSHSAPYGYGTSMARIDALAAAAGFQLTLVTAPIAPA